MPRLTVRLTADDLARLRAAAELRGASVSEVLRAAVRSVAAWAEAIAEHGDRRRPGGRRRTPWV